MGGYVHLSVLGSCVGHLSANNGTKVQLGYVHFSCTRLLRLPSTGNNGSLVNGYVDLSVLALALVIYWQKTELKNGFVHLSVLGSCVFHLSANNGTTNHGVC